MSRLRIVLIALGLLVLPLAVFGCADADDAAGSLQPDSDVVEPDTDVIEPNTMALLVRAVEDDQVVPVGGIRIAVDTIDGGRLEVITDDHGQAAVALDIDDFAGAIAHSDGRFFTAVSPGTARALIEAGKPLLFWVHPMTQPSQPQPQLQVAFGSLLNKQAEDDVVSVSSTTPSEWFSGADTPWYVLPVLPRQPFHVVGLEWAVNPTQDRVIDEPLLSATVVDHDGINEPHVIALDFAAARPITTIEGVVLAPHHQPLAEEGTLRINILADGALVGRQTYTAPMRDNSGYEFTAGYVELPGHPMTTHLEISLPDGTFTSMNLPGLPQAIQHDPGFLAPPHRTQPYGAGETPHAWNAPLHWWTNAVNPPEDPVVSYWAEGVGQVGIAYVTAFEGSFTMPALPSSTTQLPGTGDLRVTIGVCGSIDASPACELWAEEQGYFVRRPTFD